MYIGQQYATQHIPKFYASFILLTLFPQRKKNVLLLIPWGSGSVINASYFIKRSEKKYISIISYFHFPTKGPLET